MSHNPLNDTPLTDAAAEHPDGCDPLVSTEFARDMERKAAYWQHAYHKAKSYSEILEEKRQGWQRISELYSLMRSALVEKEAWELHGGFQAAACGKPIEECRQIASYKLRADCPACEHTGTIVEGDQGAQHLVTCEQCDGYGYIELPALEWMHNGKVQFALLPGDHPDYDPSE